MKFAKENAKWWFDRRKKRMTDEKKKKRINLTTVMSLTFNCKVSDISVKCQ